MPHSILLEIFTDQGIGTEIALLTMDLQRHQSFLVANYAPPAIEVVRGKGTKLWDKNGTEYLDFTSGR